MATPVASDVRQPSQAESEPNEGSSREAAKSQHGAGKTLEGALAAIRILTHADRRTFYTAVTLQMLSAVSATGLVIAGKLVLSAVSGSNDDVSISNLILPVALLAITSSVSSSASVMQVQQSRLLGDTADRDIWQSIVNVTSRVGLETYEDSQFYNRVDRLTSNAVRQPILLAHGVLGLLGGMVGVAALVVTLAVIQPILLLPLLLGIGPALTVARRTGRLEFEFARDASEMYRRRNYIRELLGHREYAKEIRAFALSAPLGERHVNAANDCLALLRPHVRRRQQYALFSVVMNTIFLAIGMLLLVVLLKHGWLSFAETGAAAIAIRMLSSQLSTMFVAVNTIAEASIFISDLQEFVEKTPVEPARPGTRWNLEQGLALRNIRYSYPGTTTQTLRGVDLDIRPGEIVGLVGENGSGKTTLAKIVAGLYPQSDGQILWDDIEIEPANRLDLRSSAAVIFQDFVHYQMSVRDNVAFGDVGRISSDLPDLLDVDVAAALSRSGADFVEKMPSKLDTLLSREFSGGTELSIGQWQRIALARAIFRSGSLVILDEPTAALDPRSEYELFSAVRTLLNGRAGLIVSHRYANLHLADRIYVLQDGQVVESGSHDQLMAAAGIYSRLYRLQADAYDSR